jgi:hypothetical protein
MGWFEDLIQKKTGNKRNGKGCIRLERASYATA